VFSEMYLQSPSHVKVLSPAIFAWGPASVTSVTVYWSEPICWMWILRRFIRQFYRIGGRPATSSPGGKEPDGRHFRLPPFAKNARRNGAPAVKNMEKDGAPSLLVEP
jgi:hypothetical protein